MKKQVVIYQLVLDRSGSMQSVAAETIAGFNEQVQRIREMNELYPFQDIRINLCLFNHHVTQPLTNALPKDLPELHPETYLPSGMTALYDAVGTSIHRLKKQLKEIGEEVRVKVFFVILTDGHENSSKQYSFEKISSQIEKLEHSKQWEFSYLGSTLDAVEIAESLNIKTRNAVYFRQSDIKSSFSHVSKSMAGFMDRFAAEAEAEDDQ